MAHSEKYEFWQATDGQWYWHKKVNGRVTADGGGYNHRSSVRRAIRANGGMNAKMTFIEN